MSAKTDRRTLLVAPNGLFAAALLMVMGTSSVSGETVSRSDQVAIANTWSQEVVSKINGHRYTVEVALPFKAPPARGYPVLYVLDGDFFFASATEFVRVIGNPNDVVVVGIGYPKEVAYANEVVKDRGPLPEALQGLPVVLSAGYLERQYDLTLPASEATLVGQTYPGFDPLESRNVGGIDTLLEVIETQIKPTVAARVPVDPSNVAIFGHSLGGLAVLHALFVEPNAFRSFLIASPSIWWARRAVLADAASFAATVAKGGACPRVMVTVGSEESKPPLKDTSLSESENRQAARFTREMRMVENAGELVSHLRAIHGRRGYEATGRVLAGQDHAPSAWSALAQTIPFAFADSVNSCRL